MVYMMVYTLEPNHQYARRYELQNSCNTNVHMSAYTDTYFGNQSNKLFLGRMLYASATFAS